MLATQIGFIGAGRMGSALLKGWLKTGVKSVQVVEPKPSAELLKLARSKKIALFAVPSLAAKLSVRSPVLGVSEVSS